MNNINIISPINQLGYGIAGLNIVKSLSNIYNVSLFPFKPLQVVTQEDADVIRQCLENSKAFDKNAPCIRIWHQHEMAEFVGKGEHIGFPFFELDVFKSVEKHHLNSLDKLFVTSKWAKNICENELTLDNDNIITIPLGVDVETFKPSITQSHNSSTVFFNCGKWEVRKGHDILFKVFCDTFEENDNVELWMMCSNPFLNESQTKEWQSLYKNCKLGEKIKFIDRVNTPQEVYNIMNNVDCGVFPSRAEGWNLELLELMSCGKQVIATNYSAHTEFCNSQNCLLVDIDETEVAFDGVWFHGSGNWGKIGKNQEEQISSHMISIHKQKHQNGAVETNINGLITAQSYNWDNIARKISNYV